MIKVLIADDQSLVREGFRTMLELEDDIEVLGEAADGAQLLELARQLHPDVILMDVRMPNLDGIEATRRLASQADPPRVLVLTTFDRDEYLYGAMKAGASGFLLKDARRSQLIGAIRTVAGGDALVDPTITRRLIERYCQMPSQGGTPSAVSELTPRELEVLKLVARGLSNSEIASAMTVSEATVKTHMARILSKLELRDRVQAVVMAYESGLVQPGQSR
jgi:DNA-binding NarL/FixJ family response regulator